MRRSMADTELTVVRRRDRDGDSGQARSAGSADTMNVVLGVERYIEIQDERKARDVEPSSRDVAGPQAG